MCNRAESPYYVYCMDIGEWRFNSNLVFKDYINRIHSVLKFAFEIIFISIEDLDEAFVYIFRRL